MAIGNITGPHSALTDFLRENNITARTVAVRNRARRQQNDQENAVAGPSDDTGAASNVTVNSAKSTATDQIDSDGLDEEEEEEEEEVRSAKKRRVAKGKGKAVVREKAKTKAAAKRKARKAAQSDDDYENSSEDEYTAPARRILSPSKMAFDPSARPPNGSFEECADCLSEFTVTRYTVAAINGCGWLCHQCIKASGVEPFKKPIPRKRNPTARREVVNFEELERIIPLSSMCIGIITQNIDSVEALGDIGIVNTNEILRVIASRRCLTQENAQLFYNIENTSLTLYDATNLKPSAFTTLAVLNPKLTFLRLDFCGQMSGDALHDLGKHLKQLNHVELLGPFLVRVEAWKAFFATVSQMGHAALESFLITQSPRFDVDCLEILVESLTGLKELRLAEMSKMTDEWLTPLAKLNHLTRLELPFPAKSLTDNAVIDLLSSIGANLNHLNLSSNYALTDETLLEGLLKHCKSLVSLSMSDLPEISDLGVTKLFDEWSNPPLHTIDLSRCHKLATRSLDAVIKHSSMSLTSLNINSWKGLAAEAIARIADDEHLMRKLSELDISWCRSVDNFTVKDIVEKCKKLKWIKCYGCNRLTKDCPKRPDLAIFGLEAHSVLRN